LSLIKKLFKLVSEWSPKTKKCWDQASNYWEWEHTIN